MTGAKTKRAVMPESDSDVSVSAEMPTAQAVKVAKEKAASMSKQGKATETAKHVKGPSCPHCKKDTSAVSKAVSSDEDTDAASSARVTPVASMKGKTLDDQYAVAYNDYIVESTRACGMGM